MNSKEANQRYVPLNKTCIGEAEIHAATEAMRNGSLMGNGTASRDAEQALRELINSRHALLTASCTQALELSLLLLDIGHGDEVILPSFSFVSAANAVLLRGARPVFAEIDVETGNLDPVDVQQRITERTKAIVPVHYAGVSADMGLFLDMCDTHDLFLIEDAAHAIGAKYDDRNLGTLGTTGCFSFHSTKNVVTGEGGAILVQDDELADRLEVLREKGTNRAAFLKGDVDKYTWISVGSSYLLPDLLAAILIAQLEQFEEFHARRKIIHDHYMNGLNRASERGWIHLPLIPKNCQSNYHLFFFRVQNQKNRNRVLTLLRERGVQAAFHFVPLHSSPYAIKNLGGRSESLPITESFANSLIRIPLYPDLHTDECEYVIETVNKVLSEAH